MLLVVSEGPPALVAAESPLRSTYFTFDGHWNARGHDVAAGAVFEWMKQTASLPEKCGGGLPELANSAAVWNPADEARTHSNR